MKSWHLLGVILGVKSRNGIMEQQDAGSLHAQPDSQLCSVAYVLVEVAFIFRESYSQNHES